MFAASATEGVNLAVFPLMLTFPPTIVPPDVLTTVKLADVREALVMASENVADTEEFSATPIAALAGETEETVGGVLSAPPPVVKFHR